MRKTSYAVTFVVVVAVLTINILSARSPDWLVAQYDIFNSRTTIRFGLMERCENQVIDLPGPGKGGHIEYSDFQCGPFPSRTSDKCEEENKSFCIAWTSAQYFTELGIGFAATALLALLIGVSTHSRRRRIWRAVAGLVLLHAVFQIVTFGIVTELYRTSRFPGFEHARPSTGYVLNTISWVVGLLAGVGVIITGVAADHGQHWAAGNRAYQPIEG